MTNLSKSNPDIKLSPLSLSKEKLAGLIYPSISDKETVIHITGQSQAFLPTHPFLMVIHRITCNTNKDLSNFKAFLPIPCETI